MKIILGGAHLRSKYGLTKTKFGKFSFKKLSEMLNLAWSLNIKELDLADVYGDIINKVSDYHKNSKNRFKIINKIYSNKTNRHNKFSHVVEQLIRQKNKLDIESFDSVMIHNAKAVPVQLNNKNLESLKKFKITKKIGISIYSENEFNYLNKKLKFDIVQLPLNILNQKQFSKKFLLKLRKQKIKIHARSIFLQGVLSIGCKALPIYLNHLKPIVKQIEDFSKKESRSLKSLSIEFASKNKFIDKLVIGFRKNHEIKEVIDELSKVKERKKKILWEEFQSQNPLEVDPLEWIRLSGLNSSRNPSNTGLK